VASKEPISGVKRSRTTDIARPRAKAAKKASTAPESTTFDEFVSAINQHADETAEPDGFALAPGQYIRVGMRGQGEALNFSSIVKAADYVGCTPETMQLGVEDTSERYPWRTGRLHVWLASGEIIKETSADAGNDKGTPSTALMEANSVTSTPHEHVGKVWSPVSGGRVLESRPRYDLEDALTETEVSNTFHNIYCTAVLGPTIIVTLGLLLCRMKT
jgi:hypothetical protein